MVRLLCMCVRERVEQQGFLILSQPDKLNPPPSYGPKEATTIAPRAAAANATGEATTRDKSRSPLRSASERPNGARRGRRT